MAQGLQGSPSRNGPPCPGALAHSPLSRLQPPLEGTARDPETLAEMAFNTDLDLSLLKNQPPTTAPGKPSTQKSEAAQKPTLRALDPSHPPQVIRSVSPPVRGCKATARAPPGPYKCQRDRHSTCGNLELQTTLSFISKSVTELPLYFPPKYLLLNLGRRPTCPT